MSKPGRLYVPLDVNFFDDPQVAGLPDGAALLFLELLCQSKRLMGDGKFTRAQAHRLRPASETLLDALCEARLIEESENEAETYLVRSWFAWNDDSALIRAKQEAGRKGGIASGIARRARSTPKHVLQNGSSKHEAQSAKVLEQETETEISNPPVVPPGGPAPRRRARIPDQFFLTAEDRAWAVEHVPGIDLKKATEEFVTYWRGDGRPKLDWKQTWRNSMLKQKATTNGTAPANPGRPITAEDYKRRQRESDARAMALAGLLPQEDE